MATRIKNFVITYFVAAGSLWGASEAYTYFKGNDLKELIGPSWWFIYFAVPALIAAMVAIFKQEHSGTDKLLQFQKDKFEKEQQEKRKHKIDSLVKEIVEKWRTYGSPIHILTRETDLTEDEQKEIIRRSFLGVGKPESKATEFWPQWLKHKQTLTK